MNALRKEVLKTFKELHKTSKKVFKDDLNALTSAREAINKEFRQNKHVNDPLKIRELVKLSDDVRTELWTTVIQAVEKQPGVFEVKITEGVLAYEDTEEKRGPTRRCSG